MSGRRGWTLGIERKSALAAFKEYLAISQRLALMAPTNTDWQRDLGIAQSRIDSIEENM
ncbi:MAG TPA: hypothetical protein VGY54_13875 [Polyangiaceae bacterium]|nr:hypothetical protein [Polyangiaceae bacterium]